MCTLRKLISKVGLGEYKKRKALCYTCAVVKADGTPVAWFYTRRSADELFETWAGRPEQKQIDHWILTIPR